MAVLYPCDELILCGYSIIQKTRLKKAGLSRNEIDSVNLFGSLRTICSIDIG